MCFKCAVTLWSDTDKSMLIILFPGKLCKYRPGKKKEYIIIIYISIFIFEKQEV